MSYKYKCIETFSIPQLDDFEGNETGNDYQIDVGSIWQREKPVQEADTEVYLTKKDGAWIDIHKDLFDSMFAKVEVSKIDDDTVSIEMSSTELISMSEAICFCERIKYPKMEETQSALSKFTEGLYILLDHIESNEPQNE